MTNPSKPELESMDFVSGGVPAPANTNPNIDTSTMDWVSDGTPFVVQQNTAVAPSLGWAANGYGFETTELSGGGYGFGTGQRAYGWEQP